MKVKAKHFIRTMMAVAAAGMLISAADATYSEAGPVKKISSVKINVSGNSLLINRREKKKLKVKVKPKRGVSKKVRWNSSRKSVVSVTQAGVIRGRKYGRAVISARALDGSGKSARIRVRVGKKVSRLSLPAKKMELNVNQSGNVSARVSPSKATVKRVTYRSSDKSVATVSSKGIVYGKSKGTAVITASSTDGSGKKAKCFVDVKIPTQSVKLDARDGGVRLESGKSVTINAAVYPSNASNKAVRYSSSDSRVAKVAQNGVVTGDNPGTAVIRVDAVDGKSYAVVQVEVYKVELKNEKLIAHRGYSSQAPENTTASFQLAVQNGFYGVECDIRKTYDGKFVIMHDADLNRMCGYNLDIANLDLQQLREYKITAGSNIQSYPDLKIPTLEEYLQILAKSKEVHPFIELKETFTTEELNKIVEKVKEYGLLDRTYFISIHQSNLLALKEIDGVNKENLQYVYGAESFNKLVPVSDSVIQWCIQNAIDLDTRYTLITPSQVSLLHDGGRKVNVWTVNVLDKAFELVNDANVDMLTTEYMLNSL